VKGARRKEARVEAMAGVEANLVRVEVLRAVPAEAVRAAKMEGAQVAPVAAWTGRRAVVLAWAVTRRG